MSKKHKIGRSVDEKKFPLPVYEKKDDIYNREQEEPLDEEGNPILDENGNPITRRVVNEDKSPGDNLDVPGAELDDEDEDIGEEDEENNYYSLGGDRHEDLEEDNEGVQGDKD